MCQGLFGDLLTARRNDSNMAVFVAQKKPKYDYFFPKKNFW